MVGKGGEHAWPQRFDEVSIAIFAIIVNLNLALFAIISTQQRLSVLKTGMPYFHATFREHVPSILKHGLGARIVRQNWEGCAPGVYLAAAPELCLFVMFDQYVQFGDPGSVPRDHLEQIVVLVIDDSRVRQDRLGPDPLINRNDVWLYEGVIDVRGMPILGVNDVIPGEATS